MSLPEDWAGFSREELIELVGRLFGHIQVLEARIAELEGQPKPPTDAGKERKPPFSVKANRPGPSQEGTRETQPRLCPAAGGADPPGGARHGQLPRLPGCSDRREGVRQPPGDHPARVRARVTEHVVLERTCQKCRKHWAPEPDWSAMTAGRQRMGISVQSEVSVLREECRLPFRVIQRYLKWRFGLGLSVGELAALTRGAAEHGREEYDRLRQEIRASPVVYGDETGWRQDGRNGYLVELQHSRGALLSLPAQPGPDGGGGGVGG